MGWASGWMPQEVRNSREIFQRVGDVCENCPRELSFSGDISSGFSETGNYIKSWKTPLKVQVFLFSKLFIWKVITNTIAQSSGIVLSQAIFLFLVIIFVFNARETFLFESNLFSFRFICSIINSPLITGIHFDASHTFAQNLGLSESKITFLAYFWYNSRITAQVISPCTFLQSDLEN